MSVNFTTLAAPLAMNADVLQVVAATGANLAGFVKIDNEWSRIRAIDGVFISTKRRGDFGTAQVAHPIGAKVTFALATDLPLEPGAGLSAAVNQQAPEQISMGADGPVPAPTRDTLLSITKPTALTGASMLTAPSLAADGVVFQIVSETTGAHAISINAGTHAEWPSTGKTLTFAGVIGNSITFVALKGKWATLATNGVTFV